MQPLSSMKLLEAWERGRGLNQNDRAVLLMAAAYPEATLEALADLPVGERDRRLLDLRSEVFGDRLASVVDCPACEEKLDLEFEVSDVRQSPLSPSDELTLEIENAEVHFRLPTSRDLGDALEMATTHEDAVRIVLARCIHKVERTAKSGKSIEVEDLSDSDIEAIMAAMEEADPQAHVEISVTCPSCGEIWNQTFDIASFLWTEIDSLAVRLMQEVHILASAYGWSEADILGMNPRRRGMYINMILA